VLEAISLPGLEATRVIRLARTPLDQAPLD
jgi:hypothetical protein